MNELRCICENSGGSSDNITMLIAIATAAIAVLALFLSERRSWVTAKIDIIFRCNDRYNSAEMRHHRRELALVLQQGDIDTSSFGQKKDIHAGAILDHYAQVASLLQRGMLDLELVHAEYGNKMLFHWFMLSKYIKAFREYRHDKKEIWMGVDWLVRQVASVDERWEGDIENVRPTVVQAGDFLSEETLLQD